MASKRQKKVFYKKSKVYTLLFSFSSICFVSLFFLFVFFIYDMPDLDHLESKGRKASVIFESYDGKVIATYGDLFREVVNVDDLPKHVADAVIAIEDHRFYKHRGVDVFGILRACATNIMSKRIAQGGSTLTQQLAKNLFLSHSKSIKRKIQELVLAVWLEKKFTKKQILSIYLNRVYFGSGAYGIDAAAYRFFGKSSKKLTICEAAKLAGTLKSPVKYSPIYNVANSDDRTDLVLSKMREEGFISESAMKDAMLDKEKLQHLEIPMDENRYFTDWALEQLQNILVSDNEDLIVRTTLDYRLQKNATYIIRKALNEKGFANGVGQIALVALDKTGAVRSMIGGHTYSTSQYNRSLALRSFGSSFKFFTYLVALEKGMDINDTVSDLPLTIGKWSPRNYKYTPVGSVTLLNAFAKSVNTSAVRIAKKVGVDAIASKAEQLGITNEIERNYSMTLGACGVSLLDITSCFGAVMTDGIKVNPFGIISVTNHKGKVLYKAYKRREKIVISQRICEKMKIMLKAIVDSGTGRRALLPIPAYGKTGTSNDSRDANFIGFANSLVVGVWAGNDDNCPMNPKITGGTFPAEIWRDFMLSAFGYTEEKDAINIINTKHIKQRRRMKSLLDGLDL